MRYVKAIFWSAACISASTASAEIAFSDDFSSFQLSSGLVTHNGGLVCSQNPNGPDPENLTLSYPTTTNRWAMLVSPYYPRTWIGSGPTQSWAYNSSTQAMNYHAEATQYDQGFAWLSNAKFSAWKNISAQETISLDSCKGGGFCAVGPSLIVSEADYRSIYLTNSSGSNAVTVRRYSPCDDKSFVDANNQPFTFPIGSTISLRLEYKGAEDGSWLYWVNGTPAYIQVNNSPVIPAESGSYLNAKLTNNPRLGNYLTVTGNLGAYVEGRVFNAVVDEFNPITNIQATASSTYVNAPASNAVDGNPSSQWVSGGMAPGWIELDLGAIQSVKQIRLLTSQSPNGSTTHIVYAGTTPNPAMQVAVLSGQTVDNQWLSVDLGTWIAARYIRIQTTASPSWVGWREIQVYK